MDTLKKIFPHAFKVKPEDVSSLVISILIYAVLGIAGGLVITLLSHLPIISIICGALGSLVDLYAIAGIVIAILVYAKVIK